MIIRNDYDNNAPPGLQPQEAELAVLRTAVAGLVPLLRPLLRGPGAEWYDISQVYCSIG